MTGATQLAQYAEGPERSPEQRFRDMVRDLTRTHSHREGYTAEHGATTWSAYHETRVPALVRQLLGAAPAGSGELSRTHPQSRPAARLESLDTVELIDGEASRWVKRLGYDDPGDSYETIARARPQAGPACRDCAHRTCVAIRRGDLVTRRRIKGSGTIACIRLLGGLYPDVTHCHRSRGEQDDHGRWCCPRHQLEYDVRHWWHQARIITGWDTPAFRPHNTCPVCEQRDSLRIRPDAAICVECRSLWEGADQLGVLARHIQAENGESREDSVETLTDRVSDSPSTSSACPDNGHLPETGER